MNNKQFATQNRGREASPVTWTLEIDVDIGGTTSPPLGSHQYNDGDIVTVTATPNAGWEFKDWDGDVTGTNPIIQVSMNKDKIVVARFFETASSVRVATWDIEALVAQDTVSLVFEGYVNPADVGNITAIGFYYSTHGNPTDADTTIDMQELDNPFTATVTDLLFKTIYYCRAFAKYIGGEAWGEVKSMVTQNDCPIGELYHENVTQQSADFGILFTKAYKIMSIHQINLWVDTVNPPDMIEANAVHIGQYSVMPENIPEKVLWKELPGGYLDLQPDTTYYYTARIYSHNACDTGDTPSCYIPACLGVNSFTTLSPTLPSVYGYLYNGYAMLEPNFAPSLWKIPSAIEWAELANYLKTAASSGQGTVTYYPGAGGAMKEVGTSRWSSPNTGASNNSEFTGVGGGMRSGVNGTFILLKESGYYFEEGAEYGTSVHHWELDYVSSDLKYQFADTEYSRREGRSVALLYTGTGAPIALYDFDGNKYDVVNIGNQYWTVQNWKCTHLNDGTLIPNVLNPASDWYNATGPALCAYDGNEANV